MALRCQYYSSNTQRYFSDASTAAYISDSSQIIRQMDAGAIQCNPVITATTSGTNPAFGHLEIPGSTQTNGLMYVLDPPQTGARISFTCNKSSTSTTVGVWASTDASITWDGTNGVVRFSSNSAVGSNTVFAIATSTTRWRLLSYSTVNVVPSTSST